MGDIEGDIGGYGILRDVEIPDVIGSCRRSDYFRSESASIETREFVGRSRVPGGRPVQTEQSRVGRRQDGVDSKLGIARSGDVVYLSNYPVSSRVVDDYLCDANELRGDGRELPQVEGRRGQRLLRGEVSV